MRFRRFPLRAACSVVAILVPRGPASYPVYLVANALLVSIGTAARAAHRRLGLFIAWVLLAYFVQVQAGALLSPTAFALELLLLSPLLLFVLDYRPAISSQEALWALRIVNLACLVVSVASYIGQGFPVMLPYRDFSPDYYWAAYGWGGARIVTVFGFTGLVLEAAARTPSVLRTLALSAVPAANFLLPSYNIGILVGVVALGLMARRRPLLLLAMLILAAPAIYYALVLRLSTVNNTLLALYGMPPKLLAYRLVGDLFSGEPLTLLTGTGLGQFLSLPQKWCTAAMRLTQGPVELPGLYNSSHFIAYVGPVLEHLRDDPRLMLSTLNKPYTGLSTLLAETGAAGFVLVALFIRRAMGLCRQSPLALVFFAFYGMLLVVEPWHDNLWLGYALLLVTAFFSPQGSPEALQDSAALRAQR